MPIHIDCLQKEVLSGMYLEDRVMIGEPWKTHILSGSLENAYAFGDQQLPFKGPAAFHSL